MALPATPPWAEVVENESRPHWWLDPQAQARKLGLAAVEVVCEIEKQRGEPFTRIVYDAADRTVGVLGIAAVALGMV